MSKSAEAGPIRLALNIEDKALADRLAALLANVPGLRLVRGNNSADVALVSAAIVSALADGEVPLTPRELEVLTLLAEGMSNKAIARRLGISVHTAKFATSGSRPLCLQKRHLLKDESRHGGLLGRRHLSARLHRTCRSEHQRENVCYDLKQTIRSLGLLPTQNDSRTLFWES